MRTCFLVLLCAGLVVRGVEPSDPPANLLPVVVGKYVEDAFAANLALQRGQRDLDSARARLVAARGALQPKLDLAARYTVADGGRTIDFPVGDLLNPVYGALNTLSGTTRFPSVENQSIALLRPHEQETKLRLLQPLYHPEILRGTEATREQASAAQASHAALRRELRLEVQRGYFRWLQAQTAVDIYADATLLTAEAVRVNRALVANDAATEDAVLRVESDALLLEQQLLSSRADAALAAAHFNLLLNRPADTALDTVATPELEDRIRAVRAYVASGTFEKHGREELVALDHAVQAAAAAKRAADASRRPTVALAVESGLQGQSYRTGSGSAYTQASLVAEWNLFDGRRSSSRVRETANEQARAASRRTEVERQLALQADDARRRLQVATASLDAALSRQSAAARVFSLVTGRNREGLVNQLGYLDARHDLTAAQLNHANARSQLFIAFAEFDRALALSPLP